MATAAPAGTAAGWKAVVSTTATGAQTAQCDAAIAATQQGCGSRQQPIKAIAEAPLACHNKASSNTSLQAVAPTAGSGDQ